MMKTFVFAATLFLTTGTAWAGGPGGGLGGIGGAVQWFDGTRLTEARAQEWFVDRTVVDAVECPDAGPFEDCALVTTDASGVEETFRLTTAACIGDARAEGACYGGYLVDVWTLDLTGTGNDTQASLGWTRDALDPDGRWMLLDGYTTEPGYDPTLQDDTCLELLEHLAYHARRYAYYHLLSQTCVVDPVWDCGVVLHQMAFHRDQFNRVLREAVAGNCLDN